MSVRRIAMGVDGARAGWIAASLWEDGARRFTDLRLFSTIEELAAAREPGVPVAIDVPIGLPSDASPRACDVQARTLLGPGRTSSVFPAPARWMLGYAGDYGALRAEAERRKNADPAVKSLSVQAAGILPKIVEVDRYLAEHAGSDDWMIECHPEVCFVALGGGRPPAETKKTAGGRAERTRLLRHAFPDAETALATAAATWPRSQVAADDLLDAYAALHTAVAIGQAEHRSLGDRSFDGAGRPMRIVVAPDVRRHEPAVVTLRPTVDEDLPFVMAAEREEGARPYIAISPEAGHRECFTDEDNDHLIIEAGGDPAGFAILCGRKDPYDNVELGRLVVARRGEGIGSQALALLARHVFTTTKAHRFWLDVLPHNAHARGVYEAAGFTEEGTLREAWTGPNGRESLVVMSMLRREWETRAATSAVSD